MSQLIGAGLFGLLVGASVLCSLFAVAMAAAYGILFLLPGLESVVLRLMGWNARNVETKANRKERLYQREKARIMSRAVTSNAARREQMITLDDVVPCRPEQDFTALRFSAKCAGCGHERKVFSKLRRVCLSCTSRAMEAQS